jgi:hypothetical protein
MSEEALKETRSACLMLLQRRGQRRNRPKGEQRTAQAFRPGKDTHNELALKGRPNRDWSQRGDTLLFAFHVCGRFHRLCTRISLVRPPHSAVPSGRFCLGRLPRPEGLGCSVFALRAIRPSASNSKRGSALNRHDAQRLFKSTPRVRAREDRRRN